MLERKRLVEFLLLNDEKLLYIHRYSTELDDDWNSKDVSAEELVNQALVAFSNITIRFPETAEDGSDSLQNTTSADPSPVPTSSHTQSNMRHASAILHGLNRQRKEAKLCDVYLQTGSQETGAHKNILAAASKYFNCIFEGDDESASSEALILPDVNPTVFMQLIEFIYTGDIQISTDTVQDILTAATIFQLAEVQRACLDFLKQKLHPVNCLTVLRLADRLQDKDLLEASLLFAAQNFSQLEHNEDLLTLDSNLFTKLISSEEFKGLEDDRLKSIVSWAKHDATGRLNVASKLCCYVETPRLSQAYLQHLSQAKDEWESSPWLIEFLIQAHSGQLQISSDATSGPEGTRHLEYSDVIVVVGGVGAGNEVECFDMETQAWTTRLPDQNEERSRSSAFPAIPNLPYKKSACVAVVLENCLYVLGGQTVEPTRSVEIYEQIHQRWISGPEMQYARCHLGASVLGNKVYAIGGRDESSRFASCEVLHHPPTKWCPIAPMSCARSAPGVAALQNQIFVVGGVNENGEMLSTVECFNPDTNAWTMVAQMPSLKCALGVCGLEDRLYVVGGLDSSGNACNHTEVYSLETDSWQKVAGMNMRRADLGAVTYNGCVYAIGGSYGQLRFSFMERYDPSCGKWTILPAQMKRARSAAGVAVLRLNLTE
ncbi:kelch-like protein 2/3 [Clonorchis sinensis]|uniref:Kelch-like protein 2/3 n=1 Tax=Clonorchis sinensis TaxID=79923 RepID=H2KT65_CLOSI|nr:kelch-like protein 2/3 [Clonorchis sinensis]